MSRMCVHVITPVNTDNKVAWNKGPLAFADKFGNN